MFNLFVYLLNKMKRKIIIIGSGFSSISASCYLAKAGYEVTILEKNSSVGGRARLLTKDGFKFDIGPTWYWMPDVFEKFFADFDKKPSDFYDLEKLAPAYQVYFDRLDSLLISDKIEEIYEVVWYNNDENLNIRLFTIPVEDAVYAFNMLYPSILLIEFFKKKFSKEPKF